MGVSGLLRHIIKKYPSIHLPAPNPLVPVHYLFIDFNAFIYDTLLSFPTDVVYDFTLKKDVQSYEKRLVALVIENTIHLVNKGAVSHSEILNLYKEKVDNNHNFEEIEGEELERMLKAPRSNNILSTDRLERLFPEEVRDIKECIEEMFN